MKSLTWTSDWEPYDAPEGPDTPYVNFDDMVGGIAPARRVPENAFVDGRGGARAQFLRSGDGVAQEVKNTTNTSDPYMNVLGEVLGLVTATRSQPPLPKHMVTEYPPTQSGRPVTHWEYIAKEGALPAFLLPENASQLPDSFKICNKTAIVGVIDLGIALGHRRTQMEGEKTRILSAWQQSAERVSRTYDDPQLYLPFGRELYADEIDTLIVDNTAPTGSLDEEAFNRNSQTEDYRDLFGQRELGMRASHGMHTLDLAAGLDADLDVERAALVRLMVANFPDRALVGHSAAFLEYFAVFAIWRMVRMADAIWDQNNADSEKVGGYQMVINLSFGKQASSRDGNDLIAEVVTKLNKVRSGRPAVVLSLPAGNENLEQGNAKFVLSGGATETVSWRVPPGDLSANFVEVWAESLRGRHNRPLEIEVIPPVGPSSGLSQGAVKLSKSLYEHSSVFDRFPGPDKLVARIYCDLIDQTGMARPQNTGEEGTLSQAELNARATDQFRQRYIVAVKQSLIYEAGVSVAPAGVWKIRLRNRSNGPMKVELNVQTDQSANPVTAVNQRSYFEHDEYERFDEIGRKIDTYTYPSRGTEPQSLDTSNVLRRHGTINAVGISNDTATVAGHRAKDGKPEPYSSTGLRRAKGKGDPDTDMDMRGKNVDKKRVAQPSVSFPSNDGAAHFGVLASGSRDGSTAALQGTSFSAAMATRHIWEVMLSTAGLIPPPAVQKLKEDARCAEKKSTDFGAIAEAKSGDGRLPHPRQSTPRKRANLKSRLGTE